MNTPRLVLAGLIGLAATAPSLAATPRRMASDSAMRILRRQFPELASLADDGSDDDGTTEFLRAAEQGQNETVKTLLKRGADADQRDGFGRTPLLLAAAAGRTETVRILLAAKASPNAADVDGATALMVAAQFGRTKTIRALLKGGADVNLADGKGETAVHAALMSLRKDALLEIASVKGVNLDAANNAGTTPAVEAARSSVDAEMLGALIDSGADKNLPASYVDGSGNRFSGVTPLMTASLSGNVAGVKVLLARSVDVNYRDPDGKTALGMAKTVPMNQEIVDLLTSWGGRE